MTGMILIDLQKAFDTIDHDVLLKQIPVVGSSNHAVDWFQSKLSNQLFRVSLEKIYSELSSITCGVPQGLLLGRLLFLLYVNDMPRAVKANLFSYADNSRLVFQGKSIKEIKN